LGPLFLSLPKFLGGFFCVFREDFKIKGDLKKVKRSKKGKKEKKVKKSKKSKKIKKSKKNKKIKKSKKI
jgi:hypothetical protein